MVQPLGKQLGGFLTQLNILLPCDPVIALRSIYPEELKAHVHKNLHTDIYSSIIHNYKNLEATILILQ